MYKHILHPTDGAQLSRTAAAHALELAETYGATLYVLYVLQVGENEPAVEDVEAAESPDRRGERAVHNTTDVAASRDVEAVEIFDRGTTGDTILSTIDRKEIDLVIIGAHGRSGLDRIVLGSVTETVVREASVPVMVAPPVEDSPDTAGE